MAATIFEKPQKNSHHCARLTPLTVGQVWIERFTVNFYRADRPTEVNSSETGNIEITRAPALCRSDGQRSALPSGPPT
jgi:hypothetical protein